MRDRFGSRGRRGVVGAGDPAAAATRRRSWPAAATKLSCALVVACLTGRPGPAGGADPAAVEARAPHSADRLRATVAYLASEALRGRDNATPGSALAQDFLVGELKGFARGLDARRGGDDAYRQPFREAGESGTNLLAILPGRERADEYVLLGAHYDHLGTRSAADGRCNLANPPGGRPCPGATDNAAGVAALLEIGRAVRALPVPPRRSIVLALWDAEEDGLLGSQYYVDHPVVPLGKTVASIHFDIQGADLLPSLAEVSFAVGAESGGGRLEGAVRNAARKEALDLQVMSTAFGQLRSDATSFLVRLVPTVLFSDATGACYHTVGDDLGAVNFPKLLVETRIAYRLAVGLAEGEAPVFSFPGLPPATYADAVSLGRVLRRARGDLGRFRGGDRDAFLRLIGRVDGIVDRGAPSFGLLDGAALLADAAQVMALTSGLPCPASLPPGRAGPPRLTR
jgi:hypothetical protein